MSADEKDKDLFNDDLLEEVDEVEDASLLEVADGEETDAVEFAGDELEEMDPAEVEPEAVAEEQDPFAEFGDPADVSDDLDAVESVDEPADDPMALFDEPGEPDESDDVEEVSDASASGWADDQFAEPSDPDEPDAEEIDDAPASSAAALFDEEDTPAESGGFEEEYSITDKVRGSLRGGDWKERKGLLAAVAAVVVLVLGAAGFFLFGGGGGDGVHVAQPTAQQLPSPTQVAPSAPEAEPEVFEPIEELPPEPVEVEEPPTPEPPPEPVAVKEPAPEPLGPATKIVEVQALPNGNVLIRGDGEFRAVKYFGMQDPNRVVVDVYGVGRGFTGWNQSGHGPVRRIRPGIHPDKMRFVLDLATRSGPLPAYSIERDGNEVLVVVR